MTPLTPLRLLSAVISARLKTTLKMIFRLCSAENENALEFGNRQHCSLGIPLASVQAK